MNRREFLFAAAACNILPALPQTLASLDQTLPSLDKTMPSLDKTVPSLDKTVPAETASAIDQSVAAEMKQQGIVGAAVGVVQGGEIVYLQGYGLADREKRVPVTLDTVFNWASNSKPLAGVLAMQLMEKQQLGLDEDVRKYVREFPDKGSVITVRHLLAHQSGIPHYSNGKIVPTKRRYPMAQPFMDPVLALDTFNQSPLIFKPGEKEAYSSYAYILLSAVIQRAGTERFQDQVVKRVAQPLDMKSLQLDVESTGQRNWAVGYIKNDANQVVLAKEEAHFWKHGAGGFKSNVQDFARWAQALINRELVAQETEQLMWTPQSTSAGEKTTRGLGFTVEDQGGLKVSHGGSQPETKTRLVLYPEKKSGVVVLCNCGFAEVGRISTAVYRALNQK